MTLASKLALGLVVILVTILGLSLTLLTLNARERMLADYRTFALGISAVAEAGLENAMVSRNPAEIDSVLQALRGPDQVMDVFVLNIWGEIKYATQADQVGRIIPPNDPTCRVCHDSSNLDRPQTIILPENGSGRILRVARPMHNEPRCQPCHQERVLGMLLADFSLTEADQAVAATQEEFLLWALLTMMGVILAAIAFVHRMIVKPMRHFVGVTKAVGRGDFSQRVDWHDKDEIGILSTAFDQMVQRVATKTKELEALNAVAATTGQSLNLETVLKQALAKTCEVSKATWGTIHLLDEAAGELKLAVSQGLPPGVADILDHLQRGEEFAGLVAESGQPLVWNGPSSFPGSRLDTVELQPIVTVPLLAEGKVIGALALGGPAHGSFAPEDVAMLRVIGHQVGAAVENAQLHEETKRLAITDGLTGLYNRRYFYVMLEQEVTRSIRYKTRTSLLMLDLDDFKHYNDANGHLAGDRLLAAAARLMTGLARKVDTVARYGGEEFVVLMPQTDKDGAMVLAQRIVAAAQGELGNDLAGGQRVTFSAGVATYPADAATPEELVHAADTALYQAKREGKNRICASGSGTD